MLPPFHEIIKEVKQRLPYYVDDWVQGFVNPLKVLSATVFIYFTQIFPALTFSALLLELTESQMGPVEVLMAMTLGGFLFSLFAGQPLVVVGVTGPVALFCITTYDLSKRWELEFLPWFFWVSFWAGIMHFLLAIFNASVIIKWMTKFSGETFGFLIGVIYIYEGLMEVVHFFEHQEVSSALLSLLLSIGTFLVAMPLSQFRFSSLLNSWTRNTIADYALVLAIVVFTACQYFPAVSGVEISHLKTPDRMLPSLEDRAWLVDMGATPTWGIFAALLPAALLTALLFFDHNISSLLTQQPEFNLTKPSAFNYDIFILGISLIVTGLFGLPPNYGLLPQAPLHCRSLATIVEVQTGNSRKEVWEKVCETRLSAFLQSVLIMVTLTPIMLQALRWIPLGVLVGVFWFLGFSSFIGNELAERTLLLITDRSKGELHSPLALVSTWVNFKFSFIQHICVAAIFFVTLSPLSIVFPVLIILLIPLRMKIFPRFFSAEDLDRLDPFTKDAKLLTGDSKIHQAGDLEAPLLDDSLVYASEIRAGASMSRRGSASTGMSGGESYIQ